MFHGLEAAEDGAAAAGLVPHLPVLTWIEAHIYQLDDQVSPLTRIVPLPLSCPCHAHYLILCAGTTCE